MREANAVVDRNERLAKGEVEMNRPGRNPLAAGTRNDSLEVELASLSDGRR